MAEAENARSEEQQRATPGWGRPPAPFPATTIRLATRNKPRHTEFLHLLKLGRRSQSCGGPRQLLCAEGPRENGAGELARSHSSPAAPMGR